MPDAHIFSDNTQIAAISWRLIGPSFLRAYGARVGQGKLLSFKELGDLIGETHYVTAKWAAGDSDRWPNAMQLKRLEILFGESFVNEVWKPLDGILHAGGSVGSRSISLAELLAMQTTMADCLARIAAVTDRIGASSPNVVEIGRRA